MQALREIKKIINGQIVINLPEGFTDDEVEVIVLPVSKSEKSSQKLRTHDAFLNSYSPEDDGLYDDYPTR